MNDNLRPGHVPASQRPRVNFAPRQPIPIPWPTLLATLLLLAMTASAANALEPDDILLLTNKNVPQGRRLAEYYAEKRGVPPKHILELDLPATDDIPFDTYEQQVVGGTRQFLRDAGLEHKITCIVTFWGVPLRIAGRVNSPEDLAELEAIGNELQLLAASVEPWVAELENHVKAHDLSFTSAAGNDMDALKIRSDTAWAAAIAISQGMTNPSQREAFDTSMRPLTARLLGKIPQLERQLAETHELPEPPHGVSAMPPGHATSPASAPAIATREALAAESTPLEQVARHRLAAARLQDQRYNRDARRELRDLIRQDMGPFQLARLLKTQADYFQTVDTAAAFDNELALLWWDYPRSKWFPNPLNFKAKVPMVAPAIMTMRLDGPQSGTARDIILASLKAEIAGLKGQVCLDSRGIPPLDKHGKTDPYGAYDQSIRNLEKLLNDHTLMSVTFDDRPELLPAQSARDVAIYLGWYSPNLYVPSCAFSSGAIAMHIASFTMASLHRQGQGLWCRDLLNDGAAATFGPVAEPYLLAFPPADEFVPLLLTGKLTLAEVYWKTTPATSWMMAMIGDPLYMPYKNNPQLKIADLPLALQHIFQRREDGTGPSTATAPSAKHDGNRIH